MAAVKDAVIFLDIDGVLISASTMARRIADPTCVRNLNILTEATGARVVVSSTWRRFGLARVVYTLNTCWGVVAPIIGATPELDTQASSGVWRAQPRGLEIAYWLALNPHGPFVILDDEGGMGELYPYWVQVNGEDGLTASDVIKAAEILRA